VTRRRASWLGVALALLAITGGPALRAEEVEKKFDWQRFLRTRPMVTTVKSYRRGDRVTWLCRRRH